MAKALAPQNPLAEVAELFSKDGLAHKDLNNLTVAIDGLISTLEKRAGKDSSILGRMGRNPRDPYSDGKTPRSLKNDVIGFGRGLVDSFTTDPKQYLTGKSSLPDTIEKIDPTLDDTKLPDMKIPAVEDLSKEQPQPTDIEPVATEQPQSNIQPIDTNNNNGEQDSNKVLSDMVEVLIDLRDDKTQNQILQEAIEIRKIIHDQSKKVELPGGLEPNSDSAKQEDREKLAEAIATRLKDVMGDMGSNSGFDFPDRRNRRTPGGKAASPSGGSSKGKMGGRVAGVGAGLAMVGAGAAVDYGLGELGVGKDEEGNDLQVDEKQDDENWDKMTVGEKIQSGMARGVEKVGSSLFLGNIANEAKSERIKNETKYLKDKKVAAPVGETDAQASLRIASENDAREEARIEAKGSGTYVGNEKVVSGQPLSDKQMRTIDFTKSMGNSYSPEIEAQYNKQKQTVTVEPKPTVNNVGKILDKVTDQRTELKADMSESKTQMIAPIVSNKTINNTEQTIIGTPPSPHPSTNSFLRFQDKISGYTDSVR